MAIGRRSAARIAAALVTVFGVFPFTASAQWLDFSDRSFTRLQLTTVPYFDTLEKDMVAGDFNRDGWTDAIVVRKAPFALAGAAPDALLMNDHGVLRDRTAQFAPDFLFRPTDARDVLATDLDGDEWPDVVIANTYGDPPVYYRNRALDGDGNWLGFEEESGSRFPELEILLQFCAVWAGDVTGDGSPDLYFSNYARAPEIAPDVLLVNDGTGHFSDESESRLGQLRNSAFGTSVELADMDADGDLDIVKSSVLSAVPPWNEIGAFVLFNDGQGHFTTYQPVPSDSPYMFTVGDLNDDDIPDLYVVNDTQDFSVIARDVDPARVDPIQYDKTVLTSPRTLFLGGNVKMADLDNDGDLDVGVADTDIDIGICETAADSLRKLALMRNEGLHSGDLLDPWGSIQNPWNENTFDFLFIDIDRDGRLDIFSGLCAGYAVFMQEDKLRALPGVVDFGEVIVGDPRSLELTLCNNSTSPDSISAIEVDDRGFSVEPGQFDLQPFECRTVTVTAGPDSPGELNATLTVMGRGDLVVPLRGQAKEAPVLTTDTGAITVTTRADETVHAAVSIVNSGGSDLTLSVRIQSSDQSFGNLLVAGSSNTLPSVTGRLDDAGVPYSTADVAELGAFDFEGVDLTIMVLAATAVDALAMEALDVAVRGGMTLFVFGSTADQDFRAGLGGWLMREKLPTGWTAPASPHFQLGNLAHPLTDGLPVTHDFVFSSASWRLDEVTDPAATVLARNGDGSPCLVSKPVGAGQVVFFTNWALSFSWTEAADGEFLQRLLLNVTSFTRTPWLSALPRSITVPPGGAADLRLVMNALGAMPGTRSAQLVLSGNDPSLPEKIIPVELVITPNIWLRISSLAPGGQAEFEVTGRAEGDFFFERSTDLRTWTRLETLRLDGEPKSLADPAAVHETEYFYRVAQ